MPSERPLTFDEQLPRCPVEPQPPGGVLARVRSFRDRVVLDHGCGNAHFRADVEGRGGTYVGLDPYSRSSDLSCAGESIPLAGASVDVVVSNAVLHLVPHPWRDVAEIGRVLKPGGVLVGYVGFLEGNVEQARFPISHVALDEMLAEAGLRLASLSVSAYGVDYQLGHLAFPYALFPPGRDAVRVIVRALMRAWMRLLAAGAAWRRARREGTSFDETYRKWCTWLDVSHASGYHFTAVKPEGPEPASGAAPVDWAPLLRSPEGGGPLRRVARAQVRGLPEGADPQAAEWLVDDASRRAWPVRGKQLMLAREHGVALG